MLGAGLWTTGAVRRFALRAEPAARVHRAGGASDPRAELAPRVPSSGGTARRGNGGRIADGASGGGNVKRHRLSIGSSRGGAWFCVPPDLDLFGPAALARGRRGAD